MALTWERFQRLFCPQLVGHKDGSLRTGGERGFVSGNLSKGSQNPGAGVERRGEGTSPARVPRRPRAGPALLVWVSFQVKRTVRRAAGRPRRGRRPRTRLWEVQQPCSPAAVSGGHAAFGGLGLGECPEEPRACHRVRPGSRHMGERAASLAVAQSGLSGLADVELWCLTGPACQEPRAAALGCPGRHGAWRAIEDSRPPEPPPPADGVVSRRGALPHTPPSVPGRAVWPRLVRS